MVEVRFQTEADCATWNQCARAEAVVGRRLARLVSLFLQQLAALDSTEDVVHLPFDVNLDDGALELDIDGELTLSARVRHAYGDSGREVVVIERIAVA